VVSDSPGHKELEIFEVQCSSDRVGMTLANQKPSYHHGGTVENQAGVSLFHSLKHILL
jgi:hypothetical protein